MRVEYSTTELLEAGSRRGHCGICCLGDKEEIYEVFIPHK